jgi:chorismate synthase
LGSIIGEKIKVLSYGESHGVGVGVVIDGFPSGFEVDMDYIRGFLDRRRPGSSEWVSARKESDEVEVLSGVFRGVTTGAPIHFSIKNKDARSDDYDHLETVYRPSHADFTYEQKYGLRDHRGGGRSSARITAGWVAAGALLHAYVSTHGMEIRSFVKQIYSHQISQLPTMEELRNMTDPICCPDPSISWAIQAEIKKARDDKDSLGGVVSTLATGIPVGLGEPVFGKLNARLASAVMSLNAVKGIQFGGGFDMVQHKGSEVNDAWSLQQGKPVTTSNFSGGIQGGISNGMPLYFETAFKPTATIGKEQNTLNTLGQQVVLEAHGRHDPCVVPRAVVIVESLTAIVLADLYLLNLTSNIRRMTL